jgi:hypothetical protein
VSDGCKGKVYNEHPDCGARDAAAVTDFPFLTQLRLKAPQLELPNKTAAFQVRRSRSCALPGPKAQPGSRNTHLIHQDSVARYAGTFIVDP